MPFHDDRAVPEAHRLMQKVMSIAGGLLMLVAFGPGRWSLDRR